MAKTSLNLDRQADARIFSFGTTAAGGDFLYNIASFFLTITAYLFYFYSLKVT